MKETLFEYIGPEDSLNGYFQSYRLVFLKVFFGQIEKTLCQYVSADEITKRFQQYYVNRRENGLIPDINFPREEEIPVEKSADYIHDFILSVPFSEINDAGYINKISRDNKDYFILDDNLYHELEAADIKHIQYIVDLKLSLYFSEIDRDNGPLRKMFKKIFNDYIQAKSDTFTRHPVGNYFRHEIPKILYNSNMIDKDRYDINGSVGIGNWATVPWIGIFDRRVTTSAMNGVYIIYLLSADGKSLYLTFNQGCNSLDESQSKHDKLFVLQETANDIATSLDAHGFYSDGKIDLHVKSNSIAKYYEKGTIFYKEYKAEQIPSEFDLNLDLINMEKIYQDYVEYRVLNK